MSYFLLVLLLCGLWIGVPLYSPADRPAGRPAGRSGVRWVGGRIRLTGRLADRPTDRPDVGRSTGRVIKSCEERKERKHRSSNATFRTLVGTCSANGHTMLRMFRSSSQHEMYIFRPYFRKGLAQVSKMLK